MPINATECQMSLTHSA